MDYSIIGKKIKELRQVVGITQGELAEGICTQALISRIEKGDIYPSATSLYQISKKLGVDVNYFFEIGTTPRLDYLKEVERQLRQLRKKHRYKEMIDMVRVEEKNPLFKENENLQLLYWHKAIYEFEVQKNWEFALALLNKALYITTDSKKAFSEREMEILLTIGGFYVGMEDYSKALNYYDQVREAIHTTGTLQLSDKSIKTRLLYNKARVLTRLGKYSDSIDHCKEGIKWCIEEEHLYGLAQLHYHIGYNFELEEKVKPALSYIEKSILMFEALGNEEHRAFLVNKKEELYRKMLS
ncbi:helix-turn-helix transcriptional regulator [Rossellomorea aquimaris]|uniref:helix-turn-helix domain-containing protein n=1 Tax=Rossellomorea aquimaris TaxID=189382 RepID=UPI001CD2F944|nr:helix-turn-helix domain-containing protein [Rossellomorea aquimaris]MCA1061393.1 helix-turn-helix transcriptional regulator [Rossellomorea aquimaris]